MCEHFIVLKMETTTFEEFTKKMVSNEFQRQAFKAFCHNQRFGDKREEWRQQRRFSFRIKSEVFADIVNTLLTGVGFVKKNIAQVPTVKACNDERRLQTCKKSPNRVWVKQPDSTFKKTPKQVWAKQPDLACKKTQNRVWIRQPDSKKRSVFERLGPVVNSKRDSKGVELLKSSHIAQLKSKKRSTRDRLEGIVKVEGQRHCYQQKMLKTDKLMNKQCRYGLKCYRAKCPFIH
jgi:hypothetical protein